MPTSSFRAILVGSIASLMEWYSWYAAFARYFARAGASPTAQLLNAAAICAVGFLRPPPGAALLVGRRQDGGWPYLAAPPW